MRFLGWAAALVALAAGAAEPRHAAPPRYLLVSRQPIPDAAAGVVPGLGPRHRAAARGGTFLSISGGVATPVAAEAPRPFDVSDPSVAPSANRIACAATAHRDSGWRIHVLDFPAQGPMRHSEPVPRAFVSWRYDDLDPCWVDEHTLVFASTRDGQRSEYDGSPVTQLFRFDFKAQALYRLTAERNGAEEPSLDRRTGRIVYSRWWFNRTRPPGETVTDTINVWQAISIRADGSDPRLVVLRARALRRESLYQPVVARDGSLYGVLGDVAGLSPAAGNAEVVRVRPGSDRALRVAGAYVDPAITSRYGSTAGLASPSACSPMPLDHGRLLVSVDPGGRGDYGLWIMNGDGSGAKPLFDQPGTLELDAVPWTSWRAIPAPPMLASLEPMPQSLADLTGRKGTFRFLNRNVFGAGFGTERAKAARAAGPLRIRFYAALPSATSASGDTIVLIREAALPSNGRVDERGLPAGVPMFEQLVDARGRVLISAHGPAHVAGFNFGTPGGTASCVGCHRGHSTR